MSVPPFLVNNSAARDGVSHSAICSKEVEALQGLCTSCLSAPCTASLEARSDFESHWV